MLRAAISELNLSAHGDQQLALRFDVADLGNVFENDFIFGEDGGGHAGKGGVLGAGDADRTEQRIAAANDKLIHEFGDSCHVPSPQCTDEKARVKRFRQESTEVVDSVSDSFNRRACEAKPQDHSLRDGFTPRPIVRGQCLRWPVERYRPP